MNVRCQGNAGGILPSVSVECASARDDTRAFASRAVSTHGDPFMGDAPTSKRIHSHDREAPDYPAFAPTHARPAPRRSHIQRGTPANDKR